MTSLFGRIFGGKKKEVKPDTPAGMVEELLGSLIQFAQFDLTFETSMDEQAGLVRVEFAGADEELLRARDGQLLDALQLYIRRVLQHQMSDEKMDVSLDVGKFREETNQALIDLADKLRDLALKKGKSVYFRALPPKDRKVIHQYLADDGRVKSRSVGDGHYKKIKIYPVRGPVSLDGDTPDSH
jgi:spoIIIJ-associated protein